MMLTGIGMMCYKLAVTQLAQSTRSFATLYKMQTELQLPHVMVRSPPHIIIRSIRVILQ